MNAHGGVIAAGPEVGEYEGNIPAIEMHGKCSRDLTASEALKILSYTTSLQFRIGDRKIVVSGGR